MILDEINTKLNEALATTTFQPARLSVEQADTLIEDAQYMADSELNAGSDNDSDNQEIREGDGLTEIINKKEFRHIR